MNTNTYEPSTIVEVAEKVLTVPRVMEVNVTEETSKDIEDIIKAPVLVDEAIVKEEASIFEALTTEEAAVESVDKEAEEIADVSRPVITHIINEVSEAVEVSMAERVVPVKVDLEAEVLLSILEASTAEITEEIPKILEDNFVDKQELHVNVAPELSDEDVTEKVDSIFKAGIEEIVEDILEVTASVVADQNDEVSMVKVDSENTEQIVGIPAAGEKAPEAVEENDSSESFEHEKILIQNVVAAEESITPDAVGISVIPQQAAVEVDLVAVKQAEVHLKDIKKNIEVMGDKRFNYLLAALFETTEKLAQVIEAIETDTAGEVIPAQDAEKIVTLLAMDKEVASTLEGAIADHAGADISSAVTVDIPESTEAKISEKPANEKSEVIEAGFLDEVVTIKDAENQAGSVPDDVTAEVTEKIAEVPEVVQDVIVEFSVTPEAIGTSTIPKQEVIQVVDLEAVKLEDCVESIKNMATGINRAVKNLENIIHTFISQSTSKKSCSNRNHCNCPCQCCRCRCCRE